MALLAVRPLLWVTDVEATVNYYVNTLGFSFVNQLYDWSWAAVEKDGIECMFSKAPGSESFNQPAFTGSLYFTTDNIDQWWQQLREKATIVYPIENFDYQMREFAIRDCNGYLLQFGQELSTAK